MEKKAYKYRMTLQLSQLPNGEEVPDKQLELDFDNHDNLFTILERIQDKNPFNDKQQAAELVIGFKMFGEVMLKNRKHPLFEELNAVFPTFIKKLKSL